MKGNKVGNGKRRGKEIRMDEKQEEVMKGNKDGWKMEKGDMKRRIVIFLSFLTF